jgi:hypothetical protein
LYRLRVDENTLRRRNVSAKPTEYMKRLMEQEDSERAIMLKKTERVGSRSRSRFSSKRNLATKAGQYQCGQSRGTQDITPNTVLKRLSSLNTGLQIFQ